MSEALNDTRTGMLGSAIETEGTAGHCATVANSETVRETMRRLARMPDGSAPLALQDEPGWQRRRSVCLTRGGHWRKIVLALVKALELHGANVPSGHVYQFGVFTGKSMLLLSELLRPPKMWGFDSFAGLPPSTASDTHATLVGWTEGNFGAASAARSNVVDVRRDLTLALGTAHVAWVPGYFNDSLRAGAQLARARRMLPAAYVDIDSDLYSSAVDALTFLFRSRLIVPGTLVGYDDWWVIPCCAGRDPSPLLVGEGRAHAEMAAAFGVRFVCVAGPCAPALPPPKTPEWAGCSHGDGTWQTTKMERGGGKARCLCDPYSNATLARGWGVVFLVEAIGVPADEATAGFEMDEAQVAEWMRASEKCNKCGGGGEGTAAGAV